MPARPSDSMQNKPSLLWWLLGIILLLIFLFVQLPASWVVARLAPNQQYLETINGNLWRGQAQWRLPARMTPSNQPLSGSLNWQWRPWELLWLQFGTDVSIQTGSSDLDARVGLRRKGVMIKHAKGTLSGTTIGAVAPIQWPTTDITLNDVSLKASRVDGKTSWSDATGQLTWPGGQVGYPVAGKTQVLELPAMKNNISLEKDKLHFALVNDADERMGDIYLDADNMLDVQLTQRLLLNVKGYTGNAAMDTAVVSVRQPLSSIGK